MNRSDVMGRVIQAVTQIQEDSGRPVGVIDAGTRPIGDTDGFDSLSGIEATVILSAWLNHDFPDDGLFVAENGYRALSISEITENLCKTMGVEIATNE